MKALPSIIVAALLSALIGCSTEELEHAEAELAELQLFEKGKGLRLPDDMMQTLGVGTVEVAERSFQRQIDVVAKVYQSGRGPMPGRATASIDGDDASWLTVGQTVVLRSGDGESPTITGRLARIDSQAAAYGQVEALIEFPDADGRHPVGSSLAAHFADAARKTGFAVPAAAVLQSADAPFVYTVTGSHFVRTPVKLGARSGDWVEIADGLYAGDQVVASGGEAMWMIELCALKGGTPCCPVGRKPGRSVD